MRVGHAHHPGRSPVRSAGAQTGQRQLHQARSSPVPATRSRSSKGTSIRNGKREADSYIRPCPGVAECNFPVAITVPAGHWFMMGDNRGESDDSRFWGPVPTGWIIGGAFATYWPPDRIGIL